MLLLLSLIVLKVATFFNKDRMVVSNGPKGVSRSSCNCPILCNWVFGSFILGDELLQRLYECLKLAC